MASYYTKYYHQNTRNGHTYRLEVQRRGTAPAKFRAMEMLHLVDLHVGPTGIVDIDEPIIKTELSFVLVDCSDERPNILHKGGNWQEFYTQDPTLYRVQLLEDGALRWSGYITPDSWSEELRYRGTIKIMARDNIGHLQDFDFDITTETFTLREMVVRVAELTEQTITIADECARMNIAWNDYTGAFQKDNIDKARFFSDAFKDKNWLDALEDVLSSLALTLRWFDWGIFGVVPVGCIRTEDFHRELEHPIARAEFVNESGVHSLAPMYKSIKDNIGYKFRDTSDNGLDRSAFAPHAGYPSPMTSAAGYHHNFDVGAANVLPLITYMPDTSYIEAEIPMPQDTRFELKMGVLGGSYFKNVAYDVIGAHLSYHPGAQAARFAVLWKGADGSTQYYRKNSTVWSSSLVINTSDPSEESPQPNYTDFTFAGRTPGMKGRMILRLYAFHQSSSPGNDKYFSALSNISVTYALASRTSSHTQTTQNNPLANIRAERDTAFGQYIGAGNSGLCVQNVIMGGTNTDYYPIAGLCLYNDDRVRYNTQWEWTHKHLLCFHQETASILEGELRDATYDDPSYNKIYVYQFSSGLKRFHLIGGQLNVLTGRIESAVLREFWDYNSLWPEPRLGVYLVSILSVESSDPDAPIYYDGGTNIQIARPDIQEVTYTLHCRVANANGWICPKIFSKLYKDRVKAWEIDAGLPTGEQGAAFEFDVILHDQDFDQITRDYDLQIGPALVKDGDEGGMYWEEIATDGTDYTIELL